MADKEQRLGTVLSILSGVSFGALPLFATWLSQAGIGVWLQVVVRLSVSVVVLLMGLLLLRRGPVRLASRRQVRFVVLNGLLVVGSFTTYVLAIALGTPPSKVVLLVYLYPIYVVLMGPRLLGEPITWRKAIGIALGLAGAAIMVQVWAIRNLGELRPGDLAALGNGLVYAGVMVLGRRGSVREKIPPVVLTIWSFFFGLLWLLLAGGIAALAGAGHSAFMAIPTQYSLRTLGDFLGIAVLGTAVPYGLMYLGLKRMEASRVSILLLVEPLSVIAMAMIFLHQPLDVWQLAGGAIILAAGAFVLR